MIELTWIPEHGWSDLSAATEGRSFPTHHVYIIARKRDRAAVRVGQTRHPTKRFKEDLENEAIQVAADGEPVVKWAVTLQDEADGIERYLFDRLEPFAGQEAPDVEPIECRLPEEVIPGGSKDLDEMNSRLQELLESFNEGE